MYRAPITVSENNAYVLWWDNKTGNWRSSFSEHHKIMARRLEMRINLSNDTTRSDDESISASKGILYMLHGWDTNNQTGLREPVFIASNDNGQYLWTKSRYCRVITILLLVYHKNSTVTQ